MISNPMTLTARRVVVSDREVWPTCISCTFILEHVSSVMVRSNPLLDMFESGRTNVISLNMLFRVANDASRLRLLSKRLDKRRLNFP